jgi:hypothetical protein
MFWLKLMLPYLGREMVPVTSVFVGVLVSLWLFLFSAQPKEFFFDVKEVRTMKS